MTTTRPPTIYVAGPMRGVPFYNFPKFDERAEHLRQEGWAVINPADTDREAGGTDTCPHEFNPDVNYTDQEFMRAAIARDMLSICQQCTAIYMLSGWENSKGARAEHAAALAIGLEIYYEKTHKENT